MPITGEISRSAMLAKTQEFHSDEDSSHGARNMLWFEVRVERVEGLRYFVEGLRYFVVGRLDAQFLHATTQGVRV